MLFVIRSLLKSLLILAVFVPFATALPVATLTPCRTPDGAQFLILAGARSSSVWVLIYSQLSAAPWRQGAEAVRQWREAHGGLLHTSILACGWMFGALFFSYVAELALLFAGRGAASSRALLPVATYSPVAFVWIWRRIHASSRHRMTARASRRTHLDSFFVCPQRCPLLVSTASLCWEINQAMGVTNEDDRGFRRSDEMCAARPLGVGRFREDE